MFILAVHCDSVILFILFAACDSVSLFIGTGRMGKFIKGLAGISKATVQFRLDLREDILFGLKF